MSKNKRFHTLQKYIWGNLLLFICLFVYIFVYLCKKLFLLKYWDRIHGQKCYFLKFLFTKGMVSKGFFFFYNLNMEARKCSLSYHFKHLTCVLTKFFLCHVYLYTFYIQKWNNIKSDIKSDIVLDNISSTL